MDNQTETRKSDLKNRITALNHELTPLLAKVKQLQARISGLELDLSQVMDEKFVREQYQRPRNESVRELR
jgi:chromosome segregation ATPase